MPNELPDDPHLGDLDMFTTGRMQDGSPFLMTNRYARFSRTQVHDVFVPPGVGEHSRAVLADAGVSAADIDALIEAGAVRQGEGFTVAAIQNYR
jgi:crotonobetainyl-CoA:carnitine CoA-transferase CaiB-like acyl-CoA transferase